MGDGGRKTGCRARGRCACWQEKDGEVKTLLCLLAAEDLLTLILWGEGRKDFRELENMIMGKKACSVGWSSVWSCPKVLVLKGRKKGDGIWESNRAMLHNPV